MVGERIYTVFLNEQYNFPKDILTFIEEHHYFEELRQNILLYLLCEYGDIEHLPSQAEKTAYDKFKEIANECVKKLVEKGIYDTTVEDFIGKSPRMYAWKYIAEATDNSGVKHFFLRMKDCLLNMADAYIEQGESFLSEAYQAEDRRNSKITGTGFDIITNNIISYGIWAAMENNTINKQAKIANKEFQDEITNISQRIEIRSSRRISDYSTNVWIPNINESVDLFITDLFEKYLGVLIQKGFVDKETMKYVNVEKAEEILNNIDATHDKEGIIKAAFICCPFYSRIFIEALSLKNDIKGIVGCSKCFGVDEYLKSYCEDKCESNIMILDLSESEVLERVSEYFDILSVIHNQSIEDYISRLLKNRREKISKKIKCLVSSRLSNEGFEIINFIMEITKSVVEDITAMNEQDIFDRIKQYVIQQAMIYDDVNIYDEIINSTSKKLLTIVLDYSEKIKKAKNTYEKEQTNFNEIKLRINEEILSLDTELENLGLFSFSKKKEIKDRIIELQHELNKSGDELWSVKLKYTNLL